MLKESTKQICNIIRLELCERVKQSNLKKKDEIIGKIEQVVFEKSDSKSKRVLGTAYWRTLRITIGLMTENIKDKNTIAEIIRHEFLHIIANNIHCESVGHSKEFKDICQLLGYGRDIGKSSIKVEFDNESEKQNEQDYMYNLYCAECGKNVGKFKKAGKTVKLFDKYVSTCCRSKLRLEANY